MELLKLLSKSEIVAQVINFLLLLLFLRIFFWKRILKLLDERRQRIASEFENIDKTKAEIGKLRVDYEAKLAAIEETAQKRIQEAVAQGRIISEEARKKAQITAQEIIDNARAGMKYELAKARVELRDEIIDLTVKATEDIIREKLTEVEDRRLINDFLEGIEKI